MPICPLLLAAVVSNGLVDANDLSNPAALAKKFPVACLGNNCGHWNAAASLCGQSVPQFAAINDMAIVFNAWNYMGIPRER